MTYFLLVFTHILTLVNPIGVIPLFTTLTEGLEKPEIRKIAFKACLTALICLICIALGGKSLFAFFGISIHGLKVVGGIIFLITGYDMLKARVSRLKDYEEDEVAELGASAAVTPLAIPMIAGPGAMTAVMLAVDDAQNHLQQGLLLAAIVAILIITFVVLVTSQTIMSKIGESGSKVFLRIMGLILMMIAVEFFFSGLKPYVQTLTTSN